MANRALATRRSAQRGIGRAFDAFGARPFGIAVFASSVALLVYLQVGIGGSIRADAVALARMVDHPARVASFVTSVYVIAGESVETGTPLVELSPHFIDRELGQIDAEVQKLLEESKLAQARPSRPTMLRLSTPPTPSNASRKLTKSTACPSAFFTSKIYPIKKSPQHSRSLSGLSCRVFHAAKRN